MTLFRGTVVAPAQFGGTAPFPGFSGQGRRFGLGGRGWHSYNFRGKAAVPHVSAAQQGTCTLVCVNRLSGHRQQIFVNAAVRRGAVAPAVVGPRADIAFRYGFGHGGGSCRCGGCGLGRFTGQQALAALQATIAELTPFCRVGDDGARANMFALVVVREDIIAYICKMTQQHISACALQSLAHCTQVYRVTAMVSDRLPRNRSVSPSSNGASKCHTA